MLLVNFELWQADLKESTQLSCVANFTSIH